MVKRVIGIGNALIDVLVKVPGDELLKRFGFPGGSMQLVDKDKSDEVRNALRAYKSYMSAGGSVANTIHALGIMGMSPGYIGSVGNDDTGSLFTSELRQANVEPVIFVRDSSTGVAVTIVTPDSERTFATYLGAAVELNAGELSAGFFDGFNIFYLEGYLIINYDLALRACHLAKSQGLMVAIDLASYNVVESNRSHFEKIIDEYADILFANEEEVRALTGLDVLPAAEALSQKCSVVVIKMGSRGSVIRGGGEVINVKAITAKAIDTTGAGDMYAAGFLYGFSRGEALKKCGVYGSLLAGNVIEVIGAKLSSERWSSVLEQLKAPDN